MSTNTISMEAFNSQYRLHNLSVDNAVEAHHMSSMPEIGWENTKENWEDDIKSSQGLAFGVSHHQFSEKQEKLIATVIGVVFDKKIRIMDMLVNPSYWRQGLGKIVFKQLLNSIPKENSTPLELEASSAGKPLYEQFGFKSEYEVSSYFKQTNDATCEKTLSETYTEEDIKEIVALDAAAWGSTREEQIRKITKIAKKQILVDKRDDHVQGFLIYSKCDNGIRIGPWVHQDPKDSAKLFQRAFKIISQKFPSTNVSVHTSNQVAIDILNAEGFTKANFTSYHMHKGDDAPLKTNKDIYYSIWSFGYG